MQVCTSLQTDNHASTRPLSFFTGRMPFLPPNQQRQSTEGKVSFIQHFKKYAHHINTNMQQKYGTELLETNYPISFHRGPDTWMVPFCWQPDGRGNET